MRSGAARGYGSYAGEEGGIAVADAATGLSTRGEAPPVWTLSAAEALATLDTTPNGLAPGEAHRRLALYGPNGLPEPPPRSSWAILVAQLRGFLNLVLMGAAALALAVGDIKDAVMIAAVIAFNTVLGFLQEYRAEQTLAALKRMVARDARVRRGGRDSEVPAEALVPGDIVLLEAGDRVPADGRLVLAESLAVDESALTGESVAATKGIESVDLESAPLADRTSMAYMNTVITRGRAELMVTGTGAATEIGRVAGMLGTADRPLTPLQKQLDLLGKRLAVVAIVAVAVISVFELARGDTLMQMAMEAIALAVAAIPEGLPAVVTITLALGVQRMARKRAIVKALAAVETLGSTSVICTDKTGTLTMNQMTARAFWFGDASYAVSGEGYRPEGKIERIVSASARDESSMDLKPLMLPLAVCNDSRIHDGALVGDPTEGALTVLAVKGGLDPEDARHAWPRIAELPFDSERGFMATAHRDFETKTVHIFVKGAPDTVLARSSVLFAHPTEPMDEARRTRVQRESAHLASRGLRVLAVATRTIPDGSFDARCELERYATDLMLVGLVGLMDPPRAEARESIALCEGAGIAVKMITGDQPGTAASIGAELGLSGEVVTGAEIDQMSDAQLERRIGHIAVFARVTPGHKVRLVRALKAHGQVVAMTGDGVNDAPALESADIGVAMGSGTEVAKEAATIVLTDDNFATIVHAVEEGRTIYENIVKFVRFQLSTNMGALLTVFLAPLLALPTPLQPIQILWVAMIMDGPPAIALALDPARKGIMREPPRDPRAPILPWSRVVSLLGYGAIMAAGTLAVLELGMSAGDTARATTLAFTTFVLFQVFNALNVRAGAGSVIGPGLFTNLWFWLALSVVALLQVLVVHWSVLQRLFGTTDLAAGDWALAVGVGASVLSLEELRKLLNRLVSRLRPHLQRL